MNAISIVTGYRPDVPKRTQFFFSQTASIKMEIEIRLCNLRMFNNSNKWNPYRFTGFNDLAIFGRIQTSRKLNANRQN